MIMIFLLYYNSANLNVKPLITNILSPFILTSVLFCDTECGIRSTLHVHRAHVPFAARDRLLAGIAHTLHRHASTESHV